MQDSGTHRPMTCTRPLIPSIATSFKAAGKDWNSMCAGLPMQVDGRVASGPSRGCQVEAALRTASYTCD